MARELNGWYDSDHLNQVAFPLGGIGAGMVCLDGNGSFSHLSMRHEPDVFNIPMMFAALHIVSGEGKSMTRVLQGPAQKQRIFGMTGTGNGGRGSALGLPHFGTARFRDRFPFGTVELEDEGIPVSVRITGFSPFVPLDADSSSLPVAGLEYEFVNNRQETISATFSFNAENFIKTSGEKNSVRKIHKGLVLQQLAADHAKDEGYVSIRIDDESTAVDPAWFRGGWFDPLTMLWKNLESGACVDRDEYSDDSGPSAGGSVYIPLTLEPGEAKTVRVQLAWYVPQSGLRSGEDQKCCCDESACCSDGATSTDTQTYEPWYTTRFDGIDDLADYWRDSYQKLRDESACFTDTFYSSTLPPEVLEAVAANLTILKSPTVLRQKDGRLWCWEGCSDDSGCCAGSCTHVWNYAQALPSLFPDLERSLRHTEFEENQEEGGHQAFRASLPIRPVSHDFHAAADGQLGGIMKVFREWRISGDTDWLKSIWPKTKQSLDYCIETWDPGHRGILEEPHHNTYDIEFWGPDGMCGTFYVGALKAAAIMGNAVEDETAKYGELYERGKKYLETELFDGEYFTQQIRWRDLLAPDPTKNEGRSIGGGYSPEATELLELEGPKYQYGSGCLADGVLGAWIAEMCGLGSVIDPEKTRSHLVAVYKYNMKHSLAEHANPQRPTYALENEGGLLLCTWPKGGKLSLPFVYSDEVWTGIEYQVASHLLLNGEREKGLDIVRTCRARYDGRTRNPFDEYECGHWYARAMSSYGLIQGYFGIRYDAVDKMLYLGAGTEEDFEVFLSTAFGYGTAGIRNRRPFVTPVRGEIPVAAFVYNGETIPDGAS